MEISFGTQISEIMKKHKLNQREFGDRINEKKQYVSWWVKDKVKPGLKNILKILEAFPDVDANWLLRGNDFNNGNIFIVNENQDKYNIKCKKCIENEKTIKNLNYMIDVLKGKINDCNKELEKRKVG